MASKYLQKFPIPQSFNEILYEFSREILREQPIDIIEFGAAYFKAKETGQNFEWDPTKSNQPKPADYPRVKGHYIEESKPMTAASEARKEVKSQFSERSIGGKSEASAKSNASIGSEARAKIYVDDVVTRIFQNALAESN